MSARRQELQAKLVEYYEDCGFKSPVADDGTVRGEFSDDPHRLG